MRHVFFQWLYDEEELAYGALARGTDFLILTGGRSRPALNYMIRDAVASNWEDRAAPEYIHMLDESGQVEVIRLQPRDVHRVRATAVPMLGGEPIEAIEARLTVDLDGALPLYVMAIEA